MVAFTAKALLLPLLGAASISALPLPSREAELVRRLDLDLEPKVTVGLGTNMNGESNTYSLVVAPVVSPEVLDNAQVSNVLNDLVVALAGTGTNVISKNSDSTNASKRDNTAVVASPVISPDVLNNVEVSNSLNDLFAALALTGTNVKHENSNNEARLAKKDNTAVVVSPVVSPEVLNNLEISNLLNGVVVALAGTGTNVIHKNSNNVGKRDNTAIVASPVTSPDVLNNVEVSNVLNNLFAALALTGTNVKHENSNNVAKRDTVSDVLSQLKGDNTAIVAAPVVAGDAVNDLSLTDSLNNLDLGGALTGTNVHHVNSNNVGKRDNTAVVVSPVISPDVANDLSISDVLNDGFIGLAGTGTNVEHEGSNNVAKRDLINDLTGLLGGSGSDNTAIVASPVVAPDVANDLSISNVLNDGFLGLAGTGTNVEHVNSNNVGKRDNTAVVASPVVAPDVANDLSISNVLNDGFLGLAGTGTNVEHVNSNNESSSKRAPRVKPSRKIVNL